MEAGMEFIQSKMLHYFYIIYIYTIYIMRPFNF